MLRPTMASPRLAWLCLPLLLALGACDAGGWLRWLDVPSFRAVSVAEARRLAADPYAQLVQARRSSGPTLAVTGARVLDLEGDLPQDLATTDRPVVVLANDPDDGMRLAARLARAGIQGVALVEGGVSAWENEAARAEAESIPGADG